MLQKCYSVRTAYLCSFTKLPTLAGVWMVFGSAGNWLKDIEPKNFHVEQFHRPVNKTGSSTDSF